MKHKKKEFELRSVITIIAEIATILSLVLTWIMYRDAKSSTTSGAPGISPLLIILIITDGLLFLFFAFTIIRMIYLRMIRKAHVLEKKFNDYVSEKPKYLAEKSKDDEERLVEKTKQAIKNLDSNKVFDQDVYYMLLYSLFITASNSINVVSILDDNEWVTNPEEDEFLRVNLNVSNLKVHLNRIFIVNQADLKQKLNNPSIKKFVESDHSYVHLYVVMRDKLPQALITDIASGFIEFYDFAVACDVFANKEIRGTLKFESKEIEMYNMIYMKLLEYSEALNKEFYKVHVDS